MCLYLAQPTLIKIVEIHSWNKLVMLHKTLKLQSAYRVSSVLSHEAVPERVVFSENHVINEKQRLTFCPITCACECSNHRSYFTSFHSDLFNYISQSIQEIWRIQIISEKIQYLAYAIHVCIFFYFIILIFILVFNATV